MGQRTALTAIGTTSYYSYDAAGRMDTADASAMGAATAYYEHDKAGNVAKKVLGNDCFTDFDYDAGNRVTSIRNCLSDGSPLAYFIYDYDAGSRITSIQRENGDTIHYGYDGWLGGPGRCCLELHVES